MYLFSASVTIIYAIIVIIIRIIINVWSWNEINCSMIGENVKCTMVPNLSLRKVDFHGFQLFY
jgi:hypothetical protein